MADYDTPAAPEADAPLVGLDLVGPEAPPEGPVNPVTPKADRRRRRVLVPVDEREVLVDTILKEYDAVRNERQEWLDKRKDRYAKYRGWLESREYPWSDASNQHVPVIQANKLRLDAGLFNAVFGQRPIMSATPTRDGHNYMEAAERADGLLDYQMFVEFRGTQEIEKFIDQYTGDGTVFSFQPWIREKGKIHDVRTILPPPDGVTVAEFDALLESQATIDKYVSTGPGQWYGTYTSPEGIPAMVDISVYDRAEDDRKVDIEFIWDATMFDGPAMIVLDLEDIVAPMRSENLQPITGHNPNGAAWFVKRSRVHIDNIRRYVKHGQYDLLTGADLDTIGAVAEGRVDVSDSSNDEAIKQQRDTLTGVEATVDEPREYVTVLEFYGLHDCDSDGEKEHVIFTVLEEPKLLARARYLTEQYPGLPPQRPIAEARFIPVPGQLYGVGAVELQESLHDFIHVLVNQNVDFGSLAALPFFGYRPTASLKEERLKLEPGMGIPLSQPKEDLVFYQLPNKDQTWHFNMINLAMSFLEKQIQISPMQFGQVEKGSASALRTTGTTMALLQQGAAMPEQVLRRLFEGLRQVYAQFHLLNTRFLPPQKRFQVVGKQKGTSEAYAVIGDRRDINVALSFDFQATLLNANKGVVAQALLAAGQIIMSPLALQTGMVDPEMMYNWARDYLKASQLDPARYLKKPVGVSDAPAVTAEEAILAISNGELPTDTRPYEPAQEHLQKLMQFAQGPEFGMLYGGRELLFKQYLMHVQQLIQQEMQQQQLQQATQQMQMSLGAGGGGGKNTPPGTIPPPSEPGSADELAGAIAGGGGAGP